MPALPSILALTLLLALARPGMADDSIPAGLACLARAYPDHVAAATADGLTLRSGLRLPWDDGRIKTARQRMDDADLEDMFFQPYPAGQSRPVAPPADFDPGRIRAEAFFAAMYGASERDVRARLAPVRWAPSPTGQVVWATTVNGVHQRLAEVAAELAALPPALRRLVDRPSGGYCWRTIAGTARRSMHAYGAAVDINPAAGDYWRWSGGAWRNRVPWEIVAAFERHGFIWGGAWSHYDTMHFEYRPELLCAASR